MRTIEVLPRPTPPERSEVAVEVMVEPEYADWITMIEDWVTPRQDWDFYLREGTDFGKANNVEVVIDYASGEHMSSLSFRVEQLYRVDDTGEELVLIFEERDGIAKLTRLTSNGLEVGLFHILTFT
jgi:uncharacterized protein YheU (UPF0270 family)